MSIPVKVKSSWPLSLDEAKRHLRIEEEFHEDDDYISNLIQAATQKAEQYIGKDIAETTNTQQIFDWCGNELWLDEGNWLGFTSAITDSSVALTVNHIDINYNGVYIEFNEGLSADPLTLVYKTGYAEGNCPALIKQAALVKIKDLYDYQRQSFSNERENKAFESLMDSFRLVRF